MSNGGSYWDSVLLRRLSRRRALQMAAIGGASAGAIALVGCGGDDDEGGGDEPTKAPAATGEGTPKPGGTLRITLPIVTGIDPRKAASFIPHLLGSHSYSRLMRFKTTVGVLPTEDRYSPVPELVSKIENPDPLTYIFTLRDDAKFHNVPPMNGRAVVAEDVVYAFESYRELSPNKGNFDIVDTLTASAPNQVTFKLKEPFGLFLHRIASYQDLWIVPKEFIDSGERAADERTVGSGPFIFDKLEPGVQYTWKKNPDYFEKDADGNALPYLDGVALRVISDVNQVLSQFAAGQLDSIFVPANLVDSLKGQSPDAVVDEAPRNILNFLYFEPASYTDNKPPFNDERVRQGFSRGLDRDALLDVASPGGGKWPNMPINPGFSEFWWLDPQGSDIGDAGENYKYDPASARQLFEAAGVSDIEVPMHFASNVYTIVVPYYETIRQVIPNMLKESGVTVKEVPEEYSGVYIPKTFAGEFDGFALGLESVFSDVGAYWSNMFYPRDAGGGRNHSRVNDADLQAKIQKMLQEQDVDEIRSQSFELQKELSQKMYYVPVINPVEDTARQKNLRGVVNTQGPTTYAIGTEGSMTNWFES